MCAGVGVLPSSVARVLGLVAELHGVFENAADICLGILFHLFYRPLAAELGKSSCLGLALA